MDSDKLYDAIVVGAGLSGLSAATTLHNEKQSVVVLEAKNRVGGRTFTKDGLDMGAAFIGPTQKHVIAAAKRYGLGDKIKGVPTKHRFTFGLGGRVIHVKNAMDIEPLVGCKNHRAVLYIMKEINILGKKIDVNEPWKCRKAKEWDATTAEMWIEQITDNDPALNSAREFARFFVRILLGVEPNEISLLYFLWYVRAAGSTIDILIGAQSSVLCGGTQQLSVQMANHLPRGAVACSHIVNNIEQNKDHVSVTATDGKCFIAEYCILAVTPGVRNRITYSPPLEPMHNQISQRMPMGTTIKTYMFYRYSFWSQHGYNGQATIPDGKIVSQVYDTSEDRPCLMGFIVGEKGRYWQSKTKQQRQEAIYHEYNRIFASQDHEALFPVDYEEYLEWEEDPDIGGAPTGTCPPGVLTNFHAGLRQSTGRLHFAGTETATVWTGYMDGAIQAGERAATEVLNCKGVSVCQPYNAEER